ncbi:hypothetical protein FNL55_21660 [Tardiphaga sp. vice352]|uniref:hypothetical protein n=1 Tax=unclassified Tardiphaga TaxID=2631404 RepID=UPI001162DED3|nr:MULTISPECIES: hypothetical protein [unclassified Tardiphaga]MBC7583270.1 hypothetical protein [Tardiphaga sp.]QDM18334.1 hypothetical protein FNL53_22175 [Tardiphaga sp. vice278]QDM23338.1 hypothetical protein FIU28_20975 [Tardiphaga sp. vice154]QDM28559.1 hypothetical protein FNL56_22410 [Tardiphaga sp. vice304]QDM33658.1 hypothetical protein FNL55_21660 [Tardiphaga sp. vice352]
MSIDRREAAAALHDIDDIVQRVKRSRSYQLASLMLMLWGPLIALGYVVSWSWPRYAGYGWVLIDLIGVAGSLAISARNRARSGQRGFDGRVLAALAMFFGFGLLWSIGIVQLTPRQLGAFWPIYFMLVYSVAGLWLGAAFVAIGLGIIALTLVGYVLTGPWFELWMAVVNGGGLLLGGIWMRRS